MYNELDETDAAVYEKTEKKYLRELLKRGCYMQFTYFLLVYFISCTHLLVYH